MFTLLRRVAARINHHAGVSVQRTYLYRISRPDEWAAAAASDNNISLTPLPLDRVERLREVGPFDVSVGLKRLCRGDRCYTVCADGRLAHYSWVQSSGSHPITEAGLSLPVESGEIWIYDCRTGDRVRGQGIYPETLKRIVNDHFAAGYHTAWIYTRRENIASQKGILRAGFGLVSTLSALRVGNHYYRLGQS
jgi:RimJ/RimL family protein N-acetyltransferase